MTELPYSYEITRGHEPTPPRLVLTTPSAEEWLEWIE